MKYLVCPQCGHPSIQEKEHCIQEFDPVTQALEAPLLLTEFECKGCGWLAATPGTAA